MDSTDGRRGFTLIELIVVIAVIAILAAILFPVFAQAREKARQAACLSNLKQVGSAVMLYVHDYDETYPGGPIPPGGSMVFWNLWVPGPEGSWEKMPTKWGDTARTNVAFRLLPYLKTVQIFSCPSNPTGGNRFGMWDTRFTQRSYDWHGGLSLGTS